MDVTRFLDSLEQYVDARIKLAATDPDPQTRNTRSALEEAQQMAQYTRNDLVDELRGLFA